MCGRFTIQYTWAEYYEALNLIPASAKGRNDPPRYNVCPGQTIGALVNGEDGFEIIDPTWGLVPFWAKKKLKWPINARGETVDSKGMFNVAFKHKRCLIPASSFYEWDRPEPKVALPYNFHLPDNEPFFFAGIWARNDHFDTLTCAIITTAPHSNFEHIHDRQPVIFKREAWEPWMDKKTTVSDARDLLNENRGSELQFYRVSTAVNKNSAQGPELIEAID